MRPDFNKPQKNKSYYDLFEDYDLIEASFAEQYGIRLRQEDEMSWSEFTTLLAGLNEKTALGRIVAIRAEDDPNIIKNFTPEQRQIRSRWRVKMAKEVSMDEYNNAMKGFESMFKVMGQNNR